MGSPYPMKHRLLYYVAAAVLGFLSALVPGTFFIFLLAGLTVFFIYKYLGPEERGYLASLFIIAFLLRVLLSVGLYTYNHMAGWEGFASGDDRLYTLKAWQLCLRFAGDYYGRTLDLVKHAGSPRHGINSFTYLLAAFFKIFGFNALASKFVNCYIGALTPVIIYLIAKTIFDVRTAKLAAFLTAFYPSLVRWSVCNLKDPLIILMLYSSILLLTLILNKGLKAVYVISLALASYVLFHLQFLYFSGIFLCFIAAVFAAPDFAYKFRRKTVCLLAFSLVFLFAIVFVRELLYKYRLLDLLYNVSTYQAGVARSDDAGYLLFPRWYYDNIRTGYLQLWPLAMIFMEGFVYFFFSPFPWSIGSVDQLAAFPQVAVWYVMFILSVFGLARAFRLKPKECSIILIFLLISLPVWIITTGNIGASFRHRDHFAPLVFIFSSFAVFNIFSTGRKISS